ncbi:MAG: tripartite tricarboxylate transporter TctB family protein [Alphaproteobacteria bacterium]|nr:tripartite tricarboxylate transporter TctB family protein [Alphaproteobacteria bacterium]
MRPIPQDIGAGLFLLALAGLALWLGSDLAGGRLNQIGAGMFPRVVAIAIGLCGLALVIGGLRKGGIALERWQWRGPLFILGAAVAFGFAVRPLGLAVAGPLVIMLGAYASRETRWLETLVFGVVMTAFCIGLFRFALNLPIPVAPWPIGY